MSGISIIVPTHGNSTGLACALESIAHQTLDKSLIQVLVVPNPVECGAEAVIEKFIFDNPQISVKQVSSCMASASVARNIGLGLADREYTTFLDDDDWLQPRYLESAFSVASRDRVVLSPILDQKEVKLYPSRVSERLSLQNGKICDLGDLPWALGYNAGKLIPTQIAKQVRYPESLKSGEDVVFFASMLQFPELKFIGQTQSKESAYVRRVTQYSVSRRPESYEFAVKERLAVIQQLRTLNSIVQDKTALLSLERSQFNFVDAFLRKNPHFVAQAAIDAATNGITGIDWNKFRSLQPEKLVISYCFPPFSDPSGNVVAKRIADWGVAVDVVSADMGGVRTLDETTRTIADPWIVNHWMVQTPVSFGDWTSMEKFSKKALNSVKKGRGGTQYTKIYTRALWPASHLAGVLYKFENPEVYWVAEFSDPLTRDSRGLKREGVLGKSHNLDRMRRIAEPYFPFGCGTQSPFEIIEVVTLITADEVVFTNTNQRREILDVYPEKLVKEVLQKTKVCAQPRPPEHLRGAITSASHRRSNTIRIGYFGSMYKNRGLTLVEDAVEAFNSSSRSSFVIEIYTNDRVAPSGSPDWVSINPQLTYLEFLKKCEEVDVLLVIDSLTEGTGYGLNPFLPSKIADYQWSSTPILGVVEKGSPTSSLALDYKATYDHKSLMRALDQIAKNLA